MIILDYLKQAQNQRTEGITFERRKLVFKRAMQPKMMTPMLSQTIKQTKTTIIVLPIIVLCWINLIVTIKQKKTPDTNCSLK